MSFAGDEKELDAHSTQDELPINSPPSNEAHPPVVELLEITQAELSSTPIVVPMNNVLVAPVQLQERKIHELELEMVAGEESL